MELFSDRVRKRRKELGLSQKALGDKSGLGQAFISKIELNKAKATTQLLPLAAALRCTPQSLLSGESGNEPYTEAPNVSSVKSKGGLPVISWIRAGQWSDIEALRPDEVEETVDFYVGKYSRHSFALRVEGDSMTSQIPGEKRSFPAGTTLLVDPEKEARAGDFVIAKDVVTQQATFKQLMHDGGRWFLKPLNPAYSTQEIDDPAIRVIGRVMEFQINNTL